MCYNNAMLEDKNQRYVMKKTIKRRLIVLCATIPFGVLFAVLFYVLKLSNALQTILTILCWGAVYVLFEVIYFLFKKYHKPKKEKVDPFAD